MEEADYENIQEEDRGSNENCPVRLHEARCIWEEVQLTDIDRILISMRHKGTKRIIQCRNIRKYCKHVSGQAENKQNINQDSWLLTQPYLSVMFELGLKTKYNRNKFKKHSNSIHMRSKTVKCRKLRES